MSGSPVFQWRPFQSLLSAFVRMDLRNQTYGAAVGAEAGATNIEAIAAVSGISGLLVGPADLSRAYGLPPSHRNQDPRWNDALDRVVRSCRARGLASIMNASDGSDVRQWEKRGFDHVVIASDIAHLRVALARELAVARGETADALAVDV